MHRQKKIIEKYYSIARIDQVMQPKKLLFNFNVAIDKNSIKKYSFTIKNLNKSYNHCDLRIFQVKSNIELYLQIIGF